MTAGDGTVTIVSVTSEHPFQVQDWDGKVETMVAALNELSAIDAARIFPSDGKTLFGEWLKAGALKVGDQVSTRVTVEPSAVNDNRQTIAGASGPRIATANDNQPLTITDIIRDNRAARVYNLEVESRPGEVTHNYFVGDNQAWVHNRVSPKSLRRHWEQLWNMKWPTYPDGRNYDVCHIVALADGGLDDVSNIEPLTREEHIGRHKANGDFKRWGGRRRRCGC